MKIGHGLFLFAVIASAPFCERTFADVIAYDNANVPFNQNWSGNLGLDFDVNSPISVTALGAFFGGDISNLSNGVEVAIYDRSTQTQVGSAETISNSNYTSLVNGDAFISLTSPIALGIGTYTVVSFLDPNYNEGYFSTSFNPTSTENSGGGAISFVGDGRYDASGSLDYPTTIDSGPTNRYDAGTFQFVVPVPSAVWGGLGLVVSLFVARKTQYLNQRARGN